MNFTLLAALLPLLVKYEPAVLSFVQREGPQIEAFLKELQAGLQAINASNTSAKGM